MAKVYKDEAGHFTSKENDNGPCYHKVGRSGNKYQAITDKGEREDISAEDYKQLKEMELEDEEFDEEQDSDFGEEEEQESEYIKGQIFYDGEHAYKITDVNDEEVEFIDESGAKKVAPLAEFKQMVESDEFDTHGITKEEAEGLGLDLDKWEAASVDEGDAGDEGEETGDLMDPNNPKYKGMSRSGITNAKLVDEGKVVKRFDDGGKEEKLQIIEYIPYGALQDGDNRKLYGIVSDYDGSDSPKIGAIVSPSLEGAQEELKSQIELAEQGREKYLKQGKWDENWFKMLSDDSYDWDEETKKRYAEKYGWDFSKPWEEQAHMKENISTDDDDAYIEYPDGSIRRGDEYYINRKDLEEIAGPGALKHIKPAKDEDKK